MMGTLRIIGFSGGTGILLEQGIITDFGNGRNAAVLKPKQNGSTLPYVGLHCIFRHVRNRSRQFIQGTLEFR